MELTKFKVNEVVWVSLLLSLNIFTISSSISVADFEQANVCLEGLSISCFGIFEYKTKKKLN